MMAIRFLIAMTLFAICTLGFWSYFQPPIVYGDAVMKEWENRDDPFSARRVYLIVNREHPVLHWFNGSHPDIDEQGRIVPWNSLGYYTAKSDIPCVYKKVELGELCHSGMANNLSSGKETAVVIITGSLEWNEWVDDLDKSLTRN